MVGNVLLAVIAVLLALIWLSLEGISVISGLSNIVVAWIEGFNSIGEMWQTILFSKLFFYTSLVSFGVFSLIVFGPQIVCLLAVWVSNIFPARKERADILAENFRSMAESIILSRGPPLHRMPQCFLESCLFLLVAPIAVFNPAFQTPKWLGIPIVPFAVLTATHFMLLLFSMMFLKTTCRPNFLWILPKRKNVK